MKKERLKLRSTLCAVVVAGCLLAFFVGCNDKGDEPPQEPVVWEASVTAGADVDFSEVVGVARMETGGWTEPIPLQENLHWRWDAVTRTVWLSSHIPFPCWLQVTGCAGGSWFSFATRVETSRSAVSAHAMTTLIAWESLTLDGVSQSEATDSITRLFGLTSDPFEVVASDHRTAPLIRAMGSVAANFKRDSRESASLALTALETSRLEILPSGTIERVMADFLMDVANDASGTVASFTNLSVGDYDECSWDFGDGSAPISESHPSHLYTIPGAYTVVQTLKKAGADVATGSAVVRSYDPLAPAPVAAFFCDKTWGRVPLDLVFTNESTGIDPVYAWDFGDGAFSTRISPIHTFATPGRHVVTLTVDGAGGHSVKKRVVSAGAFVAVAATAAPDFTGGAHSVIPVETKVPVNRLLPTTSDITMVARGAFFYRIERYMHDNVTKFSIHDPDHVIWQYSAVGPGDGSSTNPHDLVFVSDTKAYLIRYGSKKVWIVNPSAASAEGFKIGELDLSHYGDQDGLPECTRGVIVGNRLFIAMERMNRLSSNGIWQPNEAYVAVFDTATDREIDTGRGGVNDVTGGALKGIPLVVENPISMQYLEESHTIYVQAVGTYPMKGYLGKDTGGIEGINPDTYDRMLVLDDGDRDDGPLPYGNISGMAIVSPKKGYFVGYKGWMDNFFYAFAFDAQGRVDPATVREVTGLSGKNIAVLESGASLDNRGMLWVCNRTDNGIAIIDPMDDSTNDFIVTGLPPLKVVYCVH